MTNSAGIRATEGLVSCERTIASEVAGFDAGALQLDGRSSLEALIRDNRERLLGRIRQLMGAEVRRSTDSIDVLHGVFSRVLEERASDPRDPGRFLRWTTALARHRIVDEVRRRREEAFEGAARERVLSDTPSVTSCLSLQETVQRMLAALQELEPVHRRVIELRCLEELPWLSIAAKLGRSEEAVRKLYHRSLLHLGRRLGPECEA